MFLPTMLTTPIDPIERDRIRSGRPASHMEIVQRHHVESRQIAAARLNDEEQFQPASRTTTRPLASIRRTISRALINAGQRVNPEAA